jgi:hypothetical protein
MRLLGLFLGVALAAHAAEARQSPDFSRGSTYVMQLTGSQYASGLGSYLVTPLTSLPRYRASP